MTTYKELKSVRYIDGIIAYAEKLLNIKFQSTGSERYSAFCPFHNDSKDSFRVYVDSKDEVRFHCFGVCNIEWDIYDIIIKVNKCSFREAQETFAKYMGITDFVFYGGIDSMPDKKNKPDEPVNFVEPKELDKDVIIALHDAADFYHKFLLQKEDKALKYLYRREQQYRKRKITETDSTLAEWLQTSRPTIIKYKGLLNELGFLNISTGTKYQKLSVKYFTGKQV